MKCAACRHDVVERKGEIDLRINGRLHLVRNVFYEECLVCGERVLTPEVSQDLYGKIERGEFMEETFQLPVVYGAEQESISPQSSAVKTLLWTRTYEAGD